MVMSPKYRSLYAEPTGDEPSYLIMTNYLVNNHNFNISRAPEEQNEIFNWLSRSNLHNITLPSGQVFPFHRWGLPIILSPFYALGGYMGAVFFTSLLSFFSVLSLVNFFIRKNANLIANKNLYLGVGLFLTPVFFFSGQIYPDIYCFFIVTFLISIDHKRFKNSYKLGLGALIFLVGALLHEKFIFLLAPLAFFLLFKKDYRLFFIACALAFIPYIIFIYSIYGFSFIDVLRSTTGLNSGLSIYNFVRSICMDLVDQRYGILWTFPLILLAFSNFRILPNYIKFSCIPLLTIYLLFYESHGGFAYPGRYMYPFYPFLLLLIFDKITFHGNSLLFNALFFVLPFILLIGYILIPSILYPFQNVPNGYLYHFLGLSNHSEFTQILPSFDTKKPGLSLSQIKEVIKSIIIIFLVLRLSFQLIKNKK